jgi:hypothetical protein
VKRRFCSYSISRGDLIIDFLGCCLKRNMPDLKIQPRSPATFGSCKPSA